MPHLARGPGDDEPLDDGWRRFDPDLSEMTSRDRLLLHLREVPELREAITASERRWGHADAFDVCETASRLAVNAYRAGEETVGQRIVTALLPALDEEGATYAPNCVAIAFLEHPAWHEAWLQPYVDRWPTPIRDELRSQQAHIRARRDAAARKHAEWHDLLRSAEGEPVDVVLDRLRGLVDAQGDDPHAELGLQVVARFLSDRHWLRRHPIDSIRLAWRYRSTRRPRRTLAQIRRPRFSG